MRSPPLPRRALLLPLLLSACGDLPAPFMGNPGATARRLAVPATPLLAIAPPTRDVLPAKQGQDLADLLALNLVREEIPALARAPQRNDWHLDLTVERTGERVVPRYAILDPRGKEQGSVEGASFSPDDWTRGDDKGLARIADDAVPKIMALLLTIRAGRDRADPNSLLNRVARVHVPEVTGAPGDGNVALTRLLRARLTEQGKLVQVLPENPDFTISGVVSIGKLTRTEQKVEIVWTVTRPSGVVVGKVSQINAIPAGTLDFLWGEVADVVTREAAGGLHSVIERFTGREPPRGAATANATPTAPTAGGGSTGTPPAGNTSAGKPATGSSPIGTTPIGTAAPKSDRK